MSDPVNHPSHYTRGGIETIAVIEAWGLCFHLANVVKYVSRAGHKDPARTVEDLKKARFYLDRKIARIEREQAIDGLAQLAAREAAPVEPAITSDAYWQRHPIGSPERLQALAEQRAKKGAP